MARPSYGLDLGNIEEALCGLANAASRIATTVTPPAADGHDATGGTVASLTEAVMGITAGLVGIAHAIDGLAQAIRDREHPHHE
jgi:hypothetical protein